MPMPPKYSAWPPSRTPLTSAPVEARREEFVMVCQLSQYPAGKRCAVPCLFGEWHNRGLLSPSTPHSRLSDFLMPTDVAEQLLDVEDQHDVALAGHGHTCHTLGAEGIQRLDHHIVVPGETVRRQDESVIAE